MISDRDLDALVGVADFPALGLHHPAMERPHFSRDELAGPQVKQRINKQWLQEAGVTYAEITHAPPREDFAVADWMPL